MRRLLFWSALLVAAHAAETATTWLAKAQAALEGGRNAEARQAFQRVLEVSPGNITAHYNLGVMDLGEGQAREALPHFQAVHRKAPNDTQALLGILHAQLDLGQSTDAAATAKVIETAAARNTAVLEQAAALLTAKGAFASAIPLLERLQQAQPRSKDAAYNLSLAHLESGDLPAAEAVLRSQMSSSARAEDYDLLGSILERAGRTEEALRAFAEAVRRNPSEEFQINYAAAMVQAGQTDPGVAAFEKATRTFPGSLRVRMGLGSAYYLNGYYEQAARTLLEVVAAHPDLAAAYDLLGRAYEAAPEQQTRIREAFEKYLRRRPRDAASLTHYAAMTPEDAQRWLSQALAVNPQFAPAHYQLGVLAQTAEDWNTAVREYQQTIRWAPGLAEAHYRLAVVYRRLGETQKADAKLAEFQKLKGEQARVERTELMRALTQR